MSLQFISVKCPQCGAMLDLENNRKQAFCTYCGNRIILYNDNEQTFKYNKNENTYRHYENVRYNYNEAEVIRAQTERMVAEHRMYNSNQFKMRQEEIENNRRLAKKLTLAGIFTIPFFPICLIFFVMASSLKHKADKMSRNY